MNSSYRPIIYANHPFKGTGEDWKCKQCGDLRCFHPVVEVTIPSNLPLNTVRIKSRWIDTLVGADLTDAQIEKYEEKGYYSEEFHLARKEFQERKNRRQSGNFDEQDGRLIYRLTK